MKSAGMLNGDVATDGIGERVDVALFMRRAERQPVPRRSLAHRRRPDRDDEVAQISRREPALAIARHPTKHGHADKQAPARVRRFERFSIFDELIDNGVHAL
jgi:hypothetical protein